MTHRRFLLFLSFACPLMTARGEDRSTIFLSLQGGAGLLEHPASVSADYGTGRTMGGRLGYQFAETWSAGAQAESFRWEPSRPGAGSLRLLPLTGWIQKDFFWTPLWTPYVYGSAGISRNSPGGFRAKAHNGVAAGIGAGIMFRLSDFNDIGLEAAGRYVDRVTSEGKGAMFFSGAAVLRFYLPESWVPLRPEVDISLAELEEPLFTDEQRALELDPALLAEQEVLSLQEDLAANKFPPILFEPSNAILLTTSFPALDRLGALLRKYPSIRFRIAGYVEVGDKEDLGLLRAQVAGIYLVQNFYVNQARFVYVGSIPPAPKESSAPRYSGIQFDLVPR